jgi:hypothetical protein
MLQLATTAQRKVLTCRRNVVRAVYQTARRFNNVAWRCQSHITAICSDAITACRNPDNLFRHFHTAPCP